jgi:hypothetical protein
LNRSTRGRKEVKDFWAHSRRSAPGTGLSACIFCQTSLAKGYRSYPLRESKPQSGFDFTDTLAVFAARRALSSKKTEKKKLPSLSA